LWRTECVSRTCPSAGGKPNSAARELASELFICLLLVAAHTEQLDRHNCVQPARYSDRSTSHGAETLRVRCSRRRHDGLVHHAEHPHGRQPRCGFHPRTKTNVHACHLEAVITCVTWVHISAYLSGRAISADEQPYQPAHPNGLVATLHCCVFPEYLSNRGNVDGWARQVAVRCKQRGGNLQRGTSSPIIPEAGRESS